MDRPDRMEKWLCVRCTSKQKCRFINNFALNAMIYSLLCVVHSWNSNIRTCVISASICFPTLHIALGENRFPNDIIRPCMPAVRNNLCKIQIITGNYLFSHAISSNLFFHVSFCAFQTTFTGICTHIFCMHTQQIGCMHTEH